MAQKPEQIMDILHTARFNQLLTQHDGIGKAQEPHCEDQMCFTIATHRELIVEIGYEVTESACLPLKAAAEAAARLAFEKPVLEAYLVDAAQIAALLGGLDTAETHCAMMAELALKRSILNYVNKRNAALAPAG